MNETERESVGQSTRARPGRAGRVFAAVASAAVAVGLLTSLVGGPTDGLRRSVESDEQTSVRIERMLGEPQPDAVERCDANGCEVAKSGEVIGAGVAIRTRRGGRVRLALGSGNVGTLDRLSTLRVLERNGALDLEEGLGWFVFGDSPMSVSGAGTEVRGADAAFAFRVLGGRPTVEVQRGVVEVTTAQSAAMKVRAGETVASDRRGGLRRGPTARATTVAAAEAGEPSLASRGLGQLRAKKPGTSEERSDAVRLARHGVDVRITDGFARVTIDETFENLTDDTLEGMFRFTLPADATLDRLALEVDGVLEEGAFVERERAAAIWRGALVNGGATRRQTEEIVWVPGPWRDPALLEQQRGNRFELRVFPIARRASRRVVLSYVQTVPVSAGLRRFVVPLPVLPATDEPIGRLDVDLELRGHDQQAGAFVHGDELRHDTVVDVETWRLAERAARPNGDLVLEFAPADLERGMTVWGYSSGVRAQVPSRSQAAAAVSQTDGDYALLALRPEWPTVATSEPTALAVVVDESHSMFGAAHRRAIDVVAELVGALGDGDEVVLLACRAECRRHGSLESPRAVSPEDVRQFYSREAPRGASDLGRALAEGARALGSSRLAQRHVVYVGDGTPTLGPIRPATLVADLASEVRDDVAVSAIAIGPGADVSVLDALARWGKGARVDDAISSPAADTASRMLVVLRGGLLTDVSVELPVGALEVAPRALGQLLPGQEVHVAARLDVPRWTGDVILRGRLSGMPFERRFAVDLEPRREPCNAFVPRMYAALLVRDAEQDGGSAQRARAVQLSKAFGVASRYTSMLVLESPAMTRAFGLTHETGLSDWSGEDRPVAEQVGAYDLESASGRAPESGAEPAPDSALASATKMRKSAGLAPTRASTRPRDDAFAVGSGVFAEPPAFAGPVQSGPAMALEPFASEPPTDRGVVPMRVVWSRAISATPKIPEWSRRSSDDAAREVRLFPNRRDALVRLVRLGLASEDAERARWGIERWLERDPLDIEALEAQVDLAVALGRRDDVHDALGSRLDVAPTDVDGLVTLERISRAMGEDFAACRATISLAELKPRDVSALSGALGCTGDRGAHLLEKALLAQAEPAALAAARGDSARRPELPVSGELILDATWRGDVDVDLVLVDVDGRHSSWRWAPSGVRVVARDALERGRERVAFSSLKSGSYRLEVVGARGVSARGEVTVSGANGFVARLPFDLSGNRAFVGAIELHWTRRLEPVSRRSER